ncbi:MAG: hypothetical protein U5R30_05500 [Deltaproteobacteria bacterium]|nr:hypothetical protein [Deltaproteobacteria bacterium]
MKREKDSREEITLIGFVDPLDDDDDNTGVKISTDEDEYIVEMNRTGKKLLNMIDEEIQATGRVSVDSNGTKTSNKKALASRAVWWKAEEDAG